MAVQIALARYDPEPILAPERWQIGYVVTLDDGTTLYVPTTIYAADLAAGDEATVRAAAEADILADAASRDGGSP